MLWGLAQVRRGRLRFRLEVVVLCTSSNACMRAGKGIFNNAFKVADDIRLLGAVPEEDDEAKEVSVDKHMAQAMEERLLRGFEQEMLRDRQAMIKSMMRDGTGVAQLPAVCCVLCAVQNLVSSVRVAQSCRGLPPRTVPRGTGRSTHDGHACREHRQRLADGRRRPE